MRAIHSWQLFDALQAAGILADETRENVKRVVIVMEAGKAVVLQVERIDTEGLIEILPSALSGEAV